MPARTRTALLVGRSYLSHDLLLALDRAEQFALQGHEALTHQALGTASAAEALGLSMPVVFPIRHTLGLRLNRLLTRHAVLWTHKHNALRIIHLIPNTVPFKSFKPMKVDSCTVILQSFYTKVRVISSQNS